VFDNLIESKPKKAKMGAQTTASIVFHGLLVAGLIWATKGAAEAVKERLMDTTMVFIEPPKETPPPPDQPPPDAIVSANPPPQGFQTVLPPDVIPTEIPPVDLNQRFDAKDFTGKGVEGGIAAGIVGGTGPVDNAQIFMEGQVDDAPTVLTQGPQRYPAALASTGIGGRVVLEFVIDTLGRVDPNSYKVISTPHPAFANAAKEMLSKTVYRPGRMRGQAVAVQVRQAINFNP
jgi:protein TonB